MKLFVITSSDEEEEADNEAPPHDCISQDITIILPLSVYLTMMTMVMKTVLLKGKGR